MNLIRPIAARSCKRRRASGPGILCLGNRPGVRQDEPLQGRITILPLGDYRYAQTIEFSDALIEGAYVS